MRHFLLAIAACLGLTVPAFAQLQCRPVDAEKFIGSAVVALQEGAIKGEVLQGAQAAKFGEGGSIPEKVIAAFLLHKDDDTLLIIVTSEMACFGAAPEGAIDAFKKLYGQES